MLGSVQEKSDIQEQWDSRLHCSSIPSLSFIAEIVAYEDDFDQFDELDDEVEDMVDNQMFKNTHGCGFEEVGGKDIWLKLYASLEEPCENVFAV